MDKPNDGVIVCKPIEGDPLTPEQMRGVEEFRRAMREEAIPAMLEYRREQARIKAKNIAEGRVFY